MKQNGRRHGSRPTGPHDPSFSLLDRPPEEDGTHCNREPPHVPLARLAVPLLSVGLVPCDTVPIHHELLSDLVPRDDTREPPVAHTDGPRPEDDRPTCVGVTRLGRPRLLERLCIESPSAVGVGGRGRGRGRRGGQGVGGERLEGRGVETRGVEGKGRRVEVRGPIEPGLTGSERGGGGRRRARRGGGRRPTLVLGPRERGDLRRRVERARGIRRRKSRGALVEEIPERGRRGQHGGRGRKGSATEGRR